MIIEFPDTAAARAWYASPAYREILPRRTAHIDGDAVIVEGVVPGYDARMTAALLRAGANGP